MKKYDFETRYSSCVAGGKQITVDTHMQYAVYHHSQEFPDTSQPSNVFVLGPFPLLMHQCCHLGVYSFALHTPPVRCNLCLAWIFFFILCHSLNYYALKVNQTDRNPFTCSMENLVQDSGCSEKGFNDHGNSANIHCKDKQFEYSKPASSKDVAAQCRNAKFSSFNGQQNNTGLSIEYH